MKAVIAQTNPTPGDFVRNFQQIQEAIKKAKQEGAKLVVTPEMAIPGYLCRDSMMTEGFIEANLRGILSVAYETTQARDITVVVGYVEKNNTGIGKPFFNSAAVIRNGAVIANYRKRLLPFYDVFDEGRYFESGKELTVIVIEGVRWGIISCEDGWNDKDVDDYRYEDNPVERYRRLGVTNLISLNSSPYVINKPHRRQMMLQKITKDGGGTLIYANQVGGMDDLVFDGNSMVVTGGKILYACGSQQGAHIVDLNGQYGFQSCDWDGPKEVKNAIVLGLKDYIRKTRFSDVVVASSGGIDSALVLCLACDAVGADHVHAIRMPSVYSSKGSVDDALELHKNLGCHDYHAPISHAELLKKLGMDFNHAKQFFPKMNPVADENIQARLRAINLMHFSNAFGALALTTGNKSENAVGYCTLGGDMMGGFAPIQDLYKTQVYQVAGLYEKMPETIITKAPSAELAPGQTDEESLLPYAVLDPIIYAYVEMGVATFSLFKNLGPDPFESLFRCSCENAVAVFFEREDACKQYDRIISLIDLSEFKRRQAAPGIKISKTAFGTGRRFPIARGRWV